MRRHRAAKNQTLSEGEKLGTIHVEFSVTAAAIGGDNAWSAGVLSRAVHLDLRPVAPQTSTYVIWDARTIHQGHEYDPAFAAGDDASGDLLNKNRNSNSSKSGKARSKGSASEDAAKKGVSSGGGDGAFRPPVVRPRAFPNRTAADRAAWRAFLAKEGYVVLAGVVSEADCAKAGALLEQDVGRIWQPANGKPVPVSP